MGRILVDDQGAEIAGQSHDRKVEERKNPAVFLKNGVDLENGPHVDLVKKGPVVADLDQEAKNLGLQNGLDQETKNQGPEKENVQLHEAKKEVDPGLSLVLNLDRGVVADPAHEPRNYPNIKNRSYILGFMSKLAKFSCRF